MRTANRPSLVSARLGFTLVELMIGLVVTSLILAALASFFECVGQGWMEADAAQDGALQSRQAFSRAQSYLASAKYVGQVSPGSLDGSATTPGAVFYWSQDNWAGHSDCGPQVGEMALIQHDPVTQTLWLYQPLPYASMTSAQQAPTAAGAAMTYADLTDPSWPNTFKSLSFVAPPVALARHVVGATFALSGIDTTTQRPIVEFTLVQSNNGQTTTQYCTATLRAPSTRPAP